MIARGVVNVLANSVNSCLISSLQVIHDQGFWRPVNVAI